MSDTPLSAAVGPLAGQALAGLLGVSLAPPSPPVDEAAVFAAGRALGRAEAEATAAAAQAALVAAAEDRLLALADAAGRALAALDRALAEALPPLAVQLSERILAALPELPADTLAALAATVQAELPAADLHVHPALADQLRSLGLAGLAIHSDAALPPQSLEARRGDEGRWTGLAARAEAFTSSFLQAAA